MRFVYRVFENGPNVQLVCDVGPGGEPVRVVPESRGDVQWVMFVPTTGPGVLPVHVVDAPGGGSAAVEMAPPDVDALTPEEHGILGPASEAWQQVQATEGNDPAALLRCAQLCVAGLSHTWRDPQWLENLLMMGGNSAVMLWTVHHDVEGAGSVLPQLSDAVLEARWLQGGPSGLFEAHEAQSIMRALGEVQQAANPAAFSPPSAEPSKKRKWFGRG